VPASIKGKEMRVPRSTTRRKQLSQNNKGGSERRMKFRFFKHSIQKRKLLRKAEEHEEGEAKKMLIGNAA